MEKMFSNYKNDDEKIERIMEIEDLLKINHSEENMKRLPSGKRRRLS